MSDFQRFAIYYLPEDRALAEFGAKWLGWDVERGATCDHWDVPGIDGITAVPRKYGFHGTLKPPFRLAEGMRFGALEQEVARFAAQVPPFEIDGLHLSRIGRFLALVPDGDASDLAKFAFACVTAFDQFRAAPSSEELARRRAAGLTPCQDDLLMQWGYPYVGDEFRFHLTLSGKLEPEALAEAETQAARRLPDLPRPFPFASVALAGEDARGMFHMIHRYALTG